MAVHRRASAAVLSACSGMLAARIIMRRYCDSRYDRNGRQGSGLCRTRKSQRSTKVIHYTHIDIRSLQHQAPPRPSPPPPAPLAPPSRGVHGGGGSDGEAGDGRGEGGARGRAEAGDHFRQSYDGKSLKNKRQFDRSENTLLCRSRECQKTSNNRILGIREQDGTR